MYSVSKSVIKDVVPDPVLFRLSQPATRLYARVMTWYVSGRQYEARVDPFQLLWIDPHRIDGKLESAGRAYFNHSNTVSEVVAGAWDEHVQPLVQYDLYTAFVAHFVEGVAWAETSFYQRVTADIMNGKYKWGCETVDEFETRLTRLERLYDTINSEGYRTQAALRTHRRQDPTLRTIHRYWPPILHEVSIDIGRDGELILHDGRHRFTIARILNIPQIPVRVKTRHTRWQSIRERYVQTGQLPTDDLTTHPDIVGLDRNE